MSRWLGVDLGGKRPAQANAILVDYTDFNFCGPSRKKPKAAGKGKGKKGPVKSTSTATLPSLASTSTSTSTSASGTGTSLPAATARSSTTVASVSRRRRARERQSGGGGGGGGGGGSGGGRCSPQPLPLPTRATARRELLEELGEHEKIFRRAIQKMTEVELAADAPGSPEKLRVQAAAAAAGGLPAAAEQPEPDAAISAKYESLVLRRVVRAMGAVEVLRRRKAERTQDVRPTRREVMADVTREAQLTEMRHAAAARIQSIRRGNTSRARAQELQEQRLSRELLERDRAAARLQARKRGQRDRARAAQLKQERFVADRHAERIGATAIQGSFRVRQSRRVAGTRRLEQHGAHAAKIQARVRSRAAKQRMRIKRKFKELDANGNGVLEGDEVRNLMRWVLGALRAPGTPGALEEDEVMAGAERALRHADTDHDGRLSFGEFAAYYARICAQIGASREAWARRARDARDGKGSKEEQDAAAVKMQSAARARRDKAAVAAKREQRGAAIKMQGAARARKSKQVVAAKREKHQGATVLQNKLRAKKAKETVRIKRKFAALDANGNGVLEGEEVKALARWVLASFKPAGQPLPERAVANTAKKMLARVDNDHDGRLDFQEFHAYYLKVTADITRFRREQAARRREREAAVAARGERSEEEVAKDHAAAGIQARVRAKKVADRMPLKRKFVELDANGNGVLERDEIAVLAAWVLSSFKPDGKTELPQEDVDACVEKLLARADKDSDGKLDFDEFAAYYDKVGADIAKFKSAQRRKQQEEGEQERGGGGEGEEQHAATKLQGAARMRTSRKIVKEKREQKAAATKLQGAARIRTSRKIVKERRAARDREPLSPKMEMPGEQ